ncbi:SDR family NAD(P)-dependent oxidoreductase [Haladaptatus halobius]|uniref:SDR family NAD(P)-dependent oxidoreductase n=1 Tax=Haladaptatus halobius TaxID=2884875 RepID=UPI001D0BD99F|nr:SDR family NAD(P)-dependent oxidoreductase [Haladaptatus halobius]
MPSTALVTGGSGGIGRSTARTLATDHDVVVQYYSNERDAKRLVDEIEDDRGRALALQCDVSDRGAVAELCERVREEFERIDVLVNNAGVGPKSGFLDRTPESIEHHLRVNLVGGIYCAQEVIGPMRTREEGRIVNVSSTAGVHGSPSDPIYGTSKGGLVALTKSLAKRYTANGIMINAVAPSVTDTPMLSEERREAAREKFPQNRIVKPEEVAAAIRFLVTDAYSSGKVIEIAGGRYL